MLGMTTTGGGISIVGLGGSRGGRTGRRPDSSALLKEGTWSRLRWKRRTLSSMTSSVRTSGWGPLIRRQRVAGSGLMGLRQTGPTGSPENLMENEMPTV